MDIAFYTATLFLYPMATSSAAERWGFQSPGQAISYRCWKAVKPAPLMILPSSVGGHNASMSHPCRACA
jgi:hypothetical protein